MSVLCLVAEWLEHLTVKPSSSNPAWGTDVFCVSVCYLSFLYM